MNYKKLILQLNYLDNDLLKYYKKVSKTLYNYGYSLDKNCNLIDTTCNKYIYTNEKLSNIINNRCGLCKILLNNSISLLQAMEFYILFYNKYKRILNVLRKLSNSNIAKSSRLRKKIELMIKKPCVFLTLTFSDNTLHNTSVKTRRKYISRFLDSTCAYYIANIDYGDNHIYTDLHGILRRATGREHYHAIIQTDFVDISLYNLGWLNVERVYCKTDSDKKLSKYITKLTNHAIKESTKRQNLLYSKKYKIL